MSFTVRYATRGDWDGVVRMGRDYLVRSGEELTESEEEALLWSGIIGQQGLVLLVAEDDRGLVGYCLLRVALSSQAVGVEVVVWQVYVDPKRARLRKLVGPGLAKIQELATRVGASRVTLHTRRVTRAYLRMLKSLGWRVYGITMVREVEPDGYHA